MVVDVTEACSNAIHSVVSRINEPKGNMHNAVVAQVFETPSSTSRTANCSATSTRTSIYCPVPEIKSSWSSESQHLKR
jgi:hypothetical protein